MDTVSKCKEILTYDNLTDYGLVSIIMPSYNSEKFIKETLDSVVMQTYKNWELIIVDDCSTDNSLKIIEQYDDNRIKVIKNQKNSGAAVSRNNAIEAAAGRWIAFLDSDDVWHKDKLYRHLEFMYNSNTAFSFTHYSVINSENRLVTDFSPKKDSYGYRAILKHCYIGCSTVIYDSERLGKFYMPTDAVKREDFACWLKILKTGEKAVCFHESLTTYRVHSNSVSSNKFKIIKFQWNVYRKVEKLSFFKSLYYMCHWAIRGVLKYR